jgi:hypothetical protein
MALAEKGRRSGSERQAGAVVALRAAAVASPQVSADRGGRLLDRSNPVGLSRRPGPGQSSEAGLVRELDQACAEIARQKRQSAAAAPAAREAAESANGAASPAEKALQKLQAAAHAKVLQERAERLAAENALLTQKLSARERALAEQDARIKSLQQHLSPAEEGTAKQAAKHIEDQTDEQRAASDRLQKKLAAATSENARLALAAAERERMLADARTRVEYLQAALAAAELECTRLVGEAAGAREKQQAEMSAFKARFDDMSRRAATAEKHLAEARERLLARLIEIDAVRARVAQADTAAGAAYDRQCQLEDALCLQQSRYEELERAQTTLAEATKALLQRFRNRERALVVAEGKIKALVEQNASLETVRERADSERPRGQETPRSRLEEAADATLQDWAELARVLGDLVERKTAPAPAMRRARSAA